MSAPKYRDDIKGNVKLHIDDYEFQCRNEIKYADEFILMYEDCSATDEFKDYLTEAEMKAAFKRALLASHKALGLPK